MLECKQGNMNVQTDEGRTTDTDGRCVIIIAHSCSGELKSNEINKIIYKIDYRLTCVRDSFDDLCLSRL